MMVLSKAVVGKPRNCLLGACFFAASLASACTGGGNVKLGSDAAVGGPYLGFTDAVREQHEQRKNRLERLSAAALKASPTFYEYVVRQRDVPNLPGDTPVLRVVFNERIFFDTALSDIRPEANAVLDVIAESLRKEPSDVALFVAGHTDSRGSDAYNIDLSYKARQ